jgi:hypothetical protein
VRTLDAPPTTTTPPSGGLPVTGVALGGVIVAGLGLLAGGYGVLEI